MQHLPMKDYSRSQVRSQIEETGEEITAEDIKDLFAVFKGQKQGLEALQETINTNANQLYAIEKELNNF